jgi:formylglycine-generating enzyme required for sulfatase activity
VAAITVVSGGSGYTGEPVVIISGGGGTGATARAMLSGDKVSLVIVLTPGSGYMAPPTVTLAAPPRRLGVGLRLVPELTVYGPIGSLARVEWADAINGRWNAWSNVLVGVDGTVLVDLRPGARARFYRAVPNSPLIDPPVPTGFVWIPPGTFVMGSPTNEASRDPDGGENQHLVTLTRGFLIMDHEITCSEYSEVMGGTSAGESVNLPVETASWSDAVEYCRKRTAMDRESGLILATQAYRLPTEAEWEYAARAGEAASTYGPIDDIAWHEGNSGGAVNIVKQKKANAWGVYDMLGNVWEWCADWFEDLPFTPQVDPSGPTSGSTKVMRGGAWSDEAEEARFANRNSEELEAGGGFRPVLTLVR